MKQETCRACKEQKQRSEFRDRPQIVKKKTGSEVYWICRDCARKKRFLSYLRKYGITEEKYMDMIETQKYCCAICSNKPKKLHIDHDHETGKVRALLCLNCNIMLGFAKENGLILQRAIHYLDQYDSNSKL